MPCLRPLRAMRVLDPLTGERRKTLAFGSSPPKGLVLDEVLSLPCSRCDYCLLQRSRDWALRLVHEKQSHEKSCFITLTYAPEHLPEGGTLVKRDFQLFMKRFRKEFGDGIRFYHCGEYGSEHFRPHYHAIIFGVCFEDAVFHSKKRGVVLNTSPTLQRLWPFGHSTVGNVTVESCAYVARYCMKKMHRQADLKRGVEPEYSTMSLKPAIGHDWYTKYKDDCSKDFLTHLGKMYRVPRYYSRLYEHDYPEQYAQIKERRRDLVLNNPDAFGMDSMRSYEITLKSRLKKLTRELD